MTKIISIDGMSCGHCKSRVESVLMAINGVNNAQASIESENVIVQISKPVSNKKLENAISDAGFDVIGIEEQE